MSAPVTAEAIMRQRRGEPASQSAGVEHSRAVAEVQAAVTVAQARPRNESIALNRVMESCKTIEVAENAFYKFRRGSETVSDATIRLAEELARCWGNIDYGIMELGRDDAAGMSEMLAFAWDLETNTKSRMTFLVPHRRDTKSGPRALTDMRDIYENNANNGARRLRECIFRVLPPYLKERAKQECHETLRRGTGNKPLKVRVADAIHAFEGLGISLDRLEAKLGASPSWTDVDVANLEVSYRSIRRNEIAPDEEFPRLGAEDTAQVAQKLVDRQKHQNSPASQISEDMRPCGAQEDTPSDKASEPEGADDAPPPEKPRQQTPVERQADELLRRILEASDFSHLEVCESDLAQIRRDLSSEQAAVLDEALDAAELRINKGDK